MKSRLAPQLLVLLVAGSLAFSQEAKDNSSEKSVKPFVNKKYFKNYNPAGVDDCQRYRNQVMEALSLKPGMVVADVGAGGGFFVREFSPLVAPNGKVYAVDIVPSFIEYIKKQAADKGLTNIECVLGNDKSVCLPPESADIIFSSQTYHHFEYPKNMLASIRKALRPNGELVMVDHRKKDGITPPPDCRLGREEVIEEVTAAGFEKKAEYDTIPGMYFIRFGKKAEK